MNGSICRRFVQTQVLSVRMGEHLWIGGCLVIGGCIERSFVPRELAVSSWV